MIPSPALIRAIHTVWQAIAPDVADLCCDNLEALEACTDADRLAPHMGFVEDGAPHAEYRALVAAHGVSKALAALAVHPQLQLI